MAIDFSALPDLAPEPKGKAPPKARAGTIDFDSLPDMPAVQYTGEARAATPDNTERSWSDFVSDLGLRARAGLRSGVAAVAETPVNLLNTLGIEDRMMDSAAAQPGAVGAVGGVARAMLNPIDEVMRMFGAQPPRAPIVQQPAAVQKFSGAVRDRAAGDRADTSLRAQVQADQLHDADGFMETIGALLHNPTAIPAELAEVVGQMGGAMVPGGAQTMILAQALNAGSMSAADVRAKLLADGVPPDQVEAKAAEVFAASAGLNAVLPKVVPGGGAVERVLAGAGRPAGSGAARFAVPFTGETVSEGVAGSGDQVLANVATGRPVMEGVGSAGALEAFLGGGMGALTGLSEPGADEAVVDPRLQQAEANDAARRAAVAAFSGDVPADTTIQFPPLAPAPPAAATPAVPVAADPEAAQVIAALTGAPPPAVAAPAPAVAQAAPPIAPAPAQEAAGMAALAPIIGQLLSPSNAAAAPVAPPTAAPPVVQAGAAAAPPPAAPLPAAAPVASSPAVEAPAAAAPAGPTGRYYRKGKRKEAVQLPDGTWRVRRKVAGQWQPWQERNTFTPMGYAESTPASGSVTVDGARVPTGAGQAPAAAATPRPPDLVDFLAKHPRGLDRAAFQAEGLDPASFAQKRGLGYPFRKEGGMTPSELRETLQESGYLPRDPDDAPPVVSDDDAVQLVQRALNGDRVVSEADQDAELQFLAAQEQEAAERGGVAAATSAEAEGAPLERRADPEGRAEVDRALEDMTPEEKDAEIVRLRQQSRTDPLTGLGNRAGLAAAKAKPVHVALDLSLFKFYNDEFGHELGDAMLREFARTIGNNNPFGSNYRTGGDEFLMGVDSEAEAQEIVEALRRDAENIEIVWEHPDGRVVTVKGVNFNAGIAAGAPGNADAELTRGKEGRPSARKGDVPSNVSVIAPANARGGEVARVSDQGNPPAGRESDTPAAAPVAPTSAKNRVTDREREEEGRDPIIRDMVRANAEVVEKAIETLRADPDAGRVAAENALRGGPVSLDDEAVLLVNKVDVRNKRDRAARRATNPLLSEAERAVAQRDFDSFEADIDAIDRALSALGSEGGRLLQFRRRMIAEDFSLEAMERKARAAKGAPLDRAEQQEIAAAHAKIATLQRELESARAERVSAESKATFESLVASMKEALGGGKSRGSLLDTLKRRADESRAALAKLRGVKSNRRQSGAVIDPVVFVHLSNIGAEWVAQKIVDFAEWTQKMAQDIGDALWGTISEEDQRRVHEAAMAQLRTARLSDAAPEGVARDLFGDKPVELNHKYVYELAAAHVRAGLKGEAEVMRAVTEDVQQSFPGVDEHDVRMLFSEYGKAKFPSRDADKAELAELRSLIQMQESIDRLEAGQPALKSGPQRYKPSLKVRERRMALNRLLRAAADRAGPASPEKLATYNQARARNLRNLIESLEAQIRAGERAPKRGATPEPSDEVKALTVQRDALRKQLDAITPKRERKPLTDAQFQERTAKVLETRLAEVQRRIRNGDYSKAPARVKRAIDKRNEEAAFALAQAKAQFAREQFDREMAARPVWRKMVGFGGETANFARAIMTSVDFSAVLRQGGFIALGHPVRAAKSIVPMIEAFLSEKAQFDIDEKIAKRKNFALYKAAGLELTEHNNHLPTKLEEAFAARWLDRLEYVPGQAGRNALRYGWNKVTLLPRASQRAYTTFLNKLRADSFDAMAETLGRRDTLTIEQAKAIAGYINVATGRGVIGSGGRGNNAAAVLNNVFFAPRLVASRFNLLGAQPVIGGLARKAGWRTQALIAWEYARFATGVAIVLALGAAAYDDEDKDGAKPFINFDPRSTDFLKMRFGKTYIDPLTGLAQVTVMLSKVISGEKITTKGDRRPLRDKDGLWRISDLTDEPDLGNVRWGQDTTGDVAARFLRTKLAPLPGALVNVLTGENVIGEKVTIGGELKNLFLPMSLRNVQDVMKEQGVPEGSAIFALELLGMGVQYRDPAKLVDNDDKVRGER